MGQFRSDYRRFAGYSAIVINLIPLVLTALWFYVNKDGSGAEAAAEYLNLLPKFLRGLTRVHLLCITTSGLVIILVVAGRSSFGRFMGGILTLVLLLAIVSLTLNLFWLM